jgi:hypothetical protein
LRTYKLIDPDGLIWDSQTFLVDWLAAANLQELLLRKKKKNYNTDQVLTFSIFIFPEIDVPVNF